MIYVVCIPSPDIAKKNVSNSFLLMNIGMSRVAHDLSRRPKITACVVSFDGGGKEGDESESEGRGRR